MPETKTIKDDPAAVLRALADGHRVAHPDGTYLKILPDGSLGRGDGRRRFGYLNFGGTWHVLPKRDMGADPKVGDVVLLDQCDGTEPTVIHAVTDRVVVFLSTFDPFYCAVMIREQFARRFAEGTISAVEYADA